MNLRTYLDDSPRGTATKLAASLGISVSYLSQMADRKAPISPQRAVEIERDTGGSVSRKDLFPDDWHRIWPELQGAAAVVAGGPPCEELLKQEALREAQGGVRQPIDREKVMT